MVKFFWTTTKHPYWKYRVTRQLRHVSHYPMQHIRKEAFIGPYCLAIESDNAVVLEVGYQWNGSNVVVDTDSDMLASAIHDAHCQGMELGVYEPTLKNWRMAASEYRRNCMAYGMPGWRAWARYLGVLVGGGNNYKWRGSFKKNFG